MLKEEVIEDLGLSPNVMNNWAPDEREPFLTDWHDDGWLSQYMQKEEGKEEDVEEDTTVLIECLNHQNAMDWLNQCQGEMELSEFEDDDELIKLVNALDAARDGIRR